MPEKKLKAKGQPRANETFISVERSFAADLVHVVEVAAVAAARSMGQGSPRASDDAAVEAMRVEFEKICMNGKIVIGEGERDKAPMLFIGESVGSPSAEGVTYPGVDIAVDPLEGTNLCSTGAPGALAVLAASERGGLLHAPDCYMEKIIAGPACRGALDIDAPVEENLRIIARCLARSVEDLVIIVLNRPRHKELIADIRKAGARIRLIEDGDLSAGIAVAIRGSGSHAVMGRGGAPEGVLTAAAMRCLHGEMVGRLVVNTPELEERVEAMGISDSKRIYTAPDLAPGKQIVFAACGVTGAVSDGGVLTGVRFFGDGCRTHTMMMTLASQQVRFIDTIHLERPPGPRGVRLY